MRSGAETNEKLIQFICSRYTHRICYIYKMSELWQKGPLQERRALIWYELWGNTADIVVSHLTELSAATLKAVLLHQPGLSRVALFVLPTGLAACLNSYIIGILQFPSPCLAPQKGLWKSILHFFVSSWWHTDKHRRKNKTLVVAGWQCQRNTPVSWTVAPNACTTHLALLKDVFLESQILKNYTITSKKYYLTKISRQRSSKRIALFPQHFKNRHTFC